MYFIYDKAIVARSSSKIIFFRKVEVEDSVTREKEIQWQQYHTLNHRGFLYFIKGNTRIQVTTDLFIYFYFIDPETLIPKLKNCMYNFMGCSTMMFGPRSFYCITYKSNQIGFNIYRRMYHHNFLVNLKDESYEDCQGITVNSNNTYIIAIKKEIRVYSQETF